MRYGGVEYDGKHPPLIDKDTFSRVQAVLTAHNNAGEKDRKHYHYAIYTAGADSPNARGDLLTDWLENASGDAVVANFVIVIPGRSSQPSARRSPSGTSAKGAPAGTVAS